MKLTINNTYIKESTYTGTEYLTKDFNGGLLTYNINKFTDILIVLGFMVAVAGFKKLFKSDKNKKVVA